MNGIPRRYRDKTFDNYDPSVSPAAKKAKAAAERALADRRNLVLIGRPGAGKTHLAAAIGNQVMGDWANVAELVMACRADVRGEDRDGHRRLTELTRDEGFVVLDDLGREKVSEWTGELIYVLVNRRYEQMRPTIVTSNLSMAELEANGYGAILSRLAEDGDIIEMASATDYRTRKEAA